MKKNYFVLLLLLYVFGANAQQQQVNKIHGSLQQLPMPKILHKADLTGLKLANKTGNKSLVSDGFIPKAGCTDTLSYPHLKQNMIDPAELYIYELEDDAAIIDPVVAQVYKTGNTSLQINGVQLVIRKAPVDFSNTINVRISVYSLSGGIPSTQLTSVNYSVPDTLLNFKHINFPSPITVSADFAVAVTLLTPDKYVDMVITDPVYNAAYDEELSYMSAQGYSFGSIKNLYALQPQPQNVDFDFVIHPMVSYTVDAPTFTATPSSTCINQSVAFNATYTPVGATTNRFLNYYAFTNYFNFSTTNATFQTYPLGFATTSTVLLSATPTYTYTTSGNYTAGFRLDLGFRAYCRVDKTTAVTVNTPPNATFSYSGASFCQSSSNATPTATTSGGTYSATPAGLSINASTGVINFAASAIGNYVVTYNVTSGACQASSTQNVAVTAALNATFSYANNSYCSNGTNPQVVLGTGATAGTFTASPSGLSINSTTGAINLAASTPNNYTVTNTIAAAGGCAADVKTFNVSIVATPVASIMAISAVCANAGSVTLSATPAGGSFSGTGVTGNSFNPATAGAGTHTVTYSVTQSGCSSTDSKQVVVGTPLNATFSYANTSYCSNGTDPQVVLASGATAGTFTATPSGLSINTVTGAINLAASTPNNYTVTNTLAAAGGCPSDVKTFNVSVVAAPVASLAAISAVCENAGNVTLSATPAGGTFTGTGVSGNSFDPVTAGAGTHTVTYSVTQFGCTSTDSKQVVVGAPLNATFSYANTSYCSNGTDPQVVLASGATAGAFTATPSGLSINTVTGAINLAASTPDTYTVTNTLAAASGCPSDVKTFNVSVVAAPVASLAAISAVCENAGNVTLSATPAGGTFTGTGVSGNSFDPVTAGAGTHTVTYSVTQSGCTSTDSKQVVVGAPLNAAFSYANTSYCSNGTDPQVVLASGATAGTFTSVAGLSINPSTGEIDLSASTPDDYTVTNTLSAANGCTGDVKTTTITVVESPVASITSVAPICEDAADIILSATPSGGTFSGTGVTGVSFSPATAGSGAHTVSYTVTENGCSGTATTQITVTAIPTITFTVPATACVNASTITLSATPSGGTFSGNGVTGTTFNPATAGNGNHILTYTVTSGACTANETATITVDECLSVNEIESIKVQLFPVPAGNELNISVSEDVAAEILTIEGKLALAPFNISKQSTYTLDTRSLAKGVYLLKLTTNTSELVRRIIIE